MHLGTQRTWLALSLTAALVLGGCGGDTTTPPKSDKGTATGKPAGTTEAKLPETKGQEQAKAEKKEHDHSGWWCAEHGIPEEECSMCSDKVAKDLKAKGDWCEKHDRAMSQCFICKPERREFYAAKHRAKLGKEPPPTEDQEEKKDVKKG